MSRAPPALTPLLLATLLLGCADRTADRAAASTSDEAAATPDVGAAATVADEIAPSALVEAGIDAYYD
ncbi:MAG TPA: hypothetical protein VLL48_09910, partial [Longimicrobiales bacterium]|nr:hypothetical protein [Longimicrobiales bacterium]